MSDQRRDEVVRRHGDLEIEDNLAAQERLWRVQKVARVVVVVVLLAALVGVFGGGPLSRGTASAAGLSVQYERIGYRDAPQMYELRFDVSTAGTARVWIDDAGMQRLDLDQVVPEPTRTALAGDRTWFEFDVTGQRPGPVTVRFEFEPRRAGVYTAELGLEGGPTVRLAQVFLP